MTMTDRHPSDPSSGRAPVPPLLPGLMPSPALLFDERARPDFRDVFGRLAVEASDIATAVTRVRLSSLDFGQEELGRVESLRVLVAELNARTLDAEARLIHADPRRAPRVELFRGLLESGALEVRSAPLGGWSPNFTVFANATGPYALLTGAHWFDRPYPHRGPAFGAVHFAEAARLGATRHGALWERAHDVTPAVWSILSRAERRSRLLTPPAG